MTTKKIDPLKAIQQNQDLKLRNAAIIYLHETKEYSTSTLAEMANLAVSTIRNYLRKFSDLLEWAKEVFLKGKAKAKETAENYWCYIDKIIMQDSSVLCKIGQTTRAPEIRAKELKWEKDGRTIKPLAAIVVHTIKCRNATAMQNMEDCLRLGMTAISPENYVANDRLNCWEEDYPQRILQNQFVQLGLRQFVIEE